MIPDGNPSIMAAFTFPGPQLSLDLRYTSVYTCVYAEHPWAGVRVHACARTHMQGEHDAACHERSVAWHDLNAAVCWKGCVCVCVCYVTDAQSLLFFVSTKENAGRARAYISTEPPTEVGAGQHLQQTGQHLQQTGTKPEALELPKGTPPIGAR